MLYIIAKINSQKNGLHSAKPRTKHPLVKEIQVYSNVGPHPFSRGV